MKNLGLLTMLFSFVLIASACNKEKEPDTNNNNNNNNNTTAPTENRLTAEVDGMSWAADTSTISCIFVIAGGYYSVTVEGNSPDGSSITLSVNLWNNTIGTFQADPFTLTNFVGMTFVTTGSESFTAPNVTNASVHGTLKIEYWDQDKISGTFSFVGGQDTSSDTMEVTNGKFSCTSVIK